MRNTRSSGKGNINQNPLFYQQGSWDDNGAPDHPDDDTWIGGDYNLQPDSPCTDAWSSEGAPTFDNDGNGRPSGAGVDMGAYEAGECPLSPIRFVRGDVDNSSRTDLTDSIAILNFLFLGGREPGCQDAADTNDSGNIDLTEAIYLLNYLFLGDSPPAAPLATCGRDPTIDKLACTSFETCIEEE